MEGVCRERLYQWKALCGVSNRKSALSGIDVPFGIDAEPFGADVAPIGSDVRGILIRYADDFLFITNTLSMLLPRAELLPKLMIFFLPEVETLKRKNSPVQSHGWICFSGMENL